MRELYLTFGPFSLIRVGRVWSIELGRLRIVCLPGCLRVTW